MNILVVVDMTNDFIDGSLGTPEAVAIVERAKEKIENFNGKVIYLQDTHSKNYLETKEGINLPVEHGIEGTFGWEIKKELYLKGSHIITKNTFGSVGLVVGLKLDRSFDMATDSIEMIGICTDICVVSNALLLKAHYPELDILVDASCCAGTSKEAHDAALMVMKSCQINVIGEQV